MKIPFDRKVIEMPGSLIWFDQEGVLSIVPKDDAASARSIEQIKSEMNELRNIIGEKKVCIVMETNNRGTSPPKEQRDFIAKEINSITKAMALVTSSPLSRMVANIFFSFKPPTYPYKLFSNEEDAREWIKQYL
jgi:hypothetical protein